MIQTFAVGRLGKDASPIAKTKNTQVSVTNFSIAVDVGFGDNKKTMWVECTVWGKMADSLQEYLTKGKQVAVWGEPSVRAWQSGQTGEATAGLQLNVSEIKLLGGGEK